MGARRKCFCAEALFPSNDVDTKGGARLDHGTESYAQL